MKKDESETTALTPLIKRLNEFVSKHADAIWKLSSVAQVTVKKHDDTYRKVTVTDQEFFLTGVREGKRDKLIFEFAPVDTQPFASMELNDREIEKVVELGNHLMTDVLEGLALPAAIRQAVKEHASAVKQKAAEEQIAVKEEQHVKYSDLHTWGSW